MKKLMAMALLAGGSLFAAPSVRIGVGIGVPVAPAPVVVAPAYVPPCPGPGYVWIGGSWVYRGAPAVVRPEYFHGRDYRAPRDSHRR